MRTDAGEQSEALFLNSAYTFERAEQAEARFARIDPGYFYSRYSNPSLDMLEQKLALLEGTERAIVTASGMAAVFAALMCCLKAGDHIVANKILFSSCYYVITQILPRYGIAYTLVDGADSEAWKNAFRASTRCAFIETPANPTLDIVDIQAAAALCRQHRAKLVVDNVFSTPLVQRPLELGADIVVYSTTKHMEGQGRTLGGAILGRKELLEKDILPFVRHTGPHMSPFTAWVTMKGLETLPLRMERICANAHALAVFLEKQPNVAKVYYPGLASHPQHSMAMRQMKNGGGMLAFELEGGKQAAFAFLNKLELLTIANNLGDTRSLINHPASTTHASIPPEERSALGLSDGLVRLSPGIEDAGDLQDDIAQALA